MKKIGRKIRWIVWLLGAAFAGAMKPLLFPDGGWPYATAAVSIVFILAIVGYVAERAIDRPSIEGDRQ